MTIIEGLQKVVECKEEDGKLYIIVTPQIDKSVLMNTFVNQYTNVLNGDLDLVKSVIEKASGDWESVGDFPIAYDEEFDKLIEVKANPMKAYMKISSEAIARKKLTFKTLIHRLSRAKVIEGINFDALEEILKKNICEIDVEVAVGIEPTLGRAGEVKMEVNLQRNTSPKKREDGTVDYREILAFTTVNKGDIIASQVPAEQGEPGIDIFGNEVPAKPQKEYELKPAIFVSVSPDGKNLIADSTGVLMNKDGVLSIKEYLELDDIDFNTGNIRFPGKIMINGNVWPGFIVESSGDILIHGGVEAATIKTFEGSIKIEGGITGKNNTLISAKNEVMINFAQDAKIECLEGTVKVESYLHHCKVICKEFVTIKDTASIIGGKIEAVDDITLKNCSNESGVTTELVLFDPLEKELNNKREQLKEARVQIDRVYTPLEKNLKNKLSIVKTFGYKEGSPQYAAYETAKQNFESIKEKSELVEDNLKKIESALSKIGQKTGCFISILGNGYAGTRMQIGKYSHLIKSDVFKRKFFIADAEIINSPIS
jgi:uncharacterized protein (DUF342 family)